MVIFNTEIECTINGNFRDAIKATKRCWVISLGNTKVIDINNNDINTIDIINNVLLS